MLTDTELLRRYAGDRSEAAFGELVARHVNLVYSTALRLVGGDEQLARDVAQSVFTDLARKAVPLCNRRRREVADGGTQANPSLSGWVYTGARFAAAKFVRAEQTRRKHEREAQVMNELLNSGSHEPEWSELRDVLDDAMSMLSDGEREAVLLRYFEGNDFRIVGAALGLSEDAARKRVSRALDKLRDALARRGSDLHFTYEWEKAPPLKNSPTSGIISLGLVGNEWKVGAWSDMIEQRLREHP